MNWGRENAQFTNIGQRQRANAQELSSNSPEQGHLALSKAGDLAIRPWAEQDDLVLGCSKTALGHSLVVIALCW